MRCLSGAWGSGDGRRLLDGGRWYYVASPESVPRDGICARACLHIPRTHVKETFAPRRLIADERCWIALIVFTACVATVVCVHRVCNNFLIFRAAFDHLIAGVDLYRLHPAEHQDLFKYSPTFALVFAPFRALPYPVALLAWNLLNVLLIYAGLRLVLGENERLAELYHDLECKPDRGNLTKESPSITEK